MKDRTPSVTFQLQQFRLSSNEAEEEEGGEAGESDEVESNGKYSKYTDHKYQLVGIFCSVPNINIMYIFFQASYLKRIRLLVLICCH